MLFISTMFVVLAYGSNNDWAATQCGYDSNQITSWGATVTPQNVLPQYPRPQMIRGDSHSWMNLNGLWDFIGTTNHEIHTPLAYKSRDKFVNASKILVPFPAESCLSGIGKTYTHLSYSTIFNDFTDRDTTSTRVLLQFGAVDWQTSVYVNGKYIGNHTGGYDSFTFDITNHMQSTNNELLVSVYDPSDTGYQPNGKQLISAITKPGGDQYTPSSGIWQTVWIEMLDDPKLYITEYKLYPTLTDIFVSVEINTGFTLVTLTVIDPSTNIAVITANGSSSTWIKMNIPNPKLWHPFDPFLYDLNISIHSSHDHVMAYFGLRQIALQNYNITLDSGAQLGVDRPANDMNGYPVELETDDYNICWDLCNKTAECVSWAYGIPDCDKYTKPMCWLKSETTSTVYNECRVSGVVNSVAVRPSLNGEPLFVAGWLDQSFWPDGLYTAPTDDALKFDLQSVLDYGLNGVRLHQKVNPERWYYWADKLGVIVMQDAVQKYGHASNATIAPFMSDLTAMIEGKFNHPSIVQWEIFNEGDCWRVFTDKSGVSVSSVVQYVREMDPTRLIDTDSGGSANDLYIADVNDIHDYPNPVDPKPSKTQYAMIGEYGGIGYFMQDKEWAKGQCHGYKRVSSAAEFASLYVDLTNMIMSNAGDISVVIYTQLSDTENECDGYMNYDRTAKWNATQAKLVYDANQNMIRNMWKRTDLKT